MGALARSVKRVCRAGIRHLERVCQRSRSPARQRVWASLFRRGRRARSSSCIVLSTCLSNNLRHLHRSFFAFTFPGFRLARLIVAAKVPLAAGCAMRLARPRGRGREGPSLRGRGSYAVRRLRVVAIRYAPLSHAPNACSQRNLTQRIKRQAGHLKLDKKRHGCDEPRVLRRADQPIFSRSREKWPRESKRISRA
jgi:hypothetical protein